MTFTLPGELLFICLDSGMVFFGQNQWSYIISMYMHLSGQTWQFQVKGFTVFFYVVVNYFTQCVLIASIVLLRSAPHRLVDYLQLLKADYPWCWIYIQASQSNHVCTFALWMPDKLNQILPLSLDLILQWDAAGNTAVNKASLLLMTLWEAPWCSRGLCCIKQFVSQQLHFSIFSNASSCEC